MADTVNSMKRVPINESSAVAIVSQAPVVTAGGSAGLAEPRKAATMVLGTLTWVDFAAVVGFNTNVGVSNTKLLPVKGEYL